MSFAVTPEMYFAIKQTLGNIRHDVLKWIQRKLDPRSHDFSEADAVKISAAGMPGEEHVIGLTVFGQGKELRIKDTYYHSTSLVNHEYFHSAIFGTHGRTLSYFLTGVIRAVQTAREAGHSSVVGSVEERQVRGTYSKIVGAKGEALLCERELKLVITFDFSDPKCLQMSVSHKDLLANRCTLSWPMLHLNIPILESGSACPFTIPMTGEQYLNATAELRLKLTHRKPNSPIKIQFKAARVGELPTIDTFCGIERDPERPLEPMFASVDARFLELRTKLRDFLPDFIESCQSEIVSQVTETEIIAEITVSWDDKMGVEATMRISCYTSRIHPAAGTSTGWKTTYDAFKCDFKE